MGLAIKAEGLKKVFGDRAVIKSCNMRVQTNTIYGFVGENGAGKTTVFKILSGMLSATSGKVDIFEMDIKTKRDYILQCIGTLIETPVFYEHLSSEDNLKIHLSYIGAKGFGVDKALSMVGLDKSNKQIVSKYSLGMRQRLGLARAICHKPKLLILDEPTNGLDPIGIKEIRELFKYLVKQENMTIILSSHILSELDQIADTIGFISQGQLIQETPIQELKKLNENSLEDYFMKMTRRAKDV